MPKKRTYNFKQLQGASSGKQNVSQDGGKTASVNERLAESRKIVGKNAELRKKELAEAVGQRSVPPALRALLGVPDTAPPRPKRGVRTRLPNRTPGPVPPASWTKRPAWMSTLVMRGLGTKKLDGANRSHSKSHDLMRFAQLVDDSYVNPLSGPPMLLHLSLKTAAEQWDMFDEEDLPMLAASIPLRLRLRLLSYLGYYGPSIHFAIFDALTSGREPVTFLDLAGLIGQGQFTLQRLVKFLKTHSTNSEPNAIPDTVADSWEDETLEAALSPSVSLNRFSQLTHLSLSHLPAGTPAPWRDLLALSKHVPSVTHLSLAYWSRPTLTPNLSTATISSRFSPDVNAGGSHYYSGLDNDFNEAATILRQLSVNLLQLRWLDLEGCIDWFPALADQGCANPDHRFLNDRLASRKTPTVTSIFAHNWKSLATIRCGQGWVPTLAALRVLPKQTMCLAHKQLLDEYMNSLDPVEVWSAQHAAADVFAVEERKAEIWLQRESLAHAASRIINLTRRENACKVIAFDHGW